MTKSATPYKTNVCKSQNYLVFILYFVRYYTKARDVLHQYQHMFSFRDIQQDCEVIVKDLRDRLKDHFRDPKSTPKQLTECVDLLLQLKEPPNELCDEYLAHAKERLDENLL